MINTKQFYSYILQKNIDFFTGVPDSLLKELCACITMNASPSHHIIAANEGNAIGLASGYYFATGKPGVVYMQNSGLGNVVNPLLSLADEAVYKIPMLLLIGWRGEPGLQDEPQHITQGKLTLPLLETLGIKYQILCENYEKQLDECFSYMEKTEKPIALVVKKGMFSEYKMKKTNIEIELKRERALEIVLDEVEKDALIVSTTGKTSREIFDIREQRGETHDRDFLTVGSMGHTSSIALGLSLGTKRKIYCIDGDGSFIMHMGGTGVAAQIAPSNFRYILINNGAHESVGGQPTVGFQINVKEILIGMGFKTVFEVEDICDLKNKLQKMSEKTAMIIRVSQGSRDELGRPTIHPVENKMNMMRLLREDEM